MLQAKYETVDVVLLLTRMQVKSKAMHQSPRACSINLTCSSLLATLCLNSANIFVRTAEFLLPMSSALFRAEI